MPFTNDGYSKGWTGSARDRLLQSQLGFLMGNPIGDYDPSPMPGLSTLLDEEGEGTPLGLLGFLGLAGAPAALAAGGVTGAGAAGGSAAAQITQEAAPVAQRAAPIAERVGRYAGGPLLGEGGTIAGPGASKLGQLAGRVGAPINPDLVHALNPSRLEAVGRGIMGKSLSNFAVTNPEMALPAAAAAATGLAGLGTAVQMENQRSDPAQGPTPMQREGTPAAPLSSIPAGETQTVAGLNREALQKARQQLRSDLKNLVYATRKGGLSTDQVFSVYNALYGRYQDRYGQVFAQQEMKQAQLDAINQVESEERAMLMDTLLGGVETGMISQENVGDWFPVLEQTYGADFPQATEEALGTAIPSNGQAEMSAYVSSLVEKMLDQGVEPTSIPSNVANMIVGAGSDASAISSKMQIQQIAQAAVNQLQTEEDSGGGWFG